MADRGDARNPGTVNGPNEYYADRVALTKGDHPFPQEAGAFTFDRPLFSNIAGTKGASDSNGTQSKPLGQSHSTGF